MTKTDPAHKHKLIEDAKKKVTVGGTYYHFKNPSDYYTVVNVGIIEETLEPCVMYEPLYVARVSTTPPWDHGLMNGLPISMS